MTYSDFVKTVDIGSKDPTEVVRAVIASVKRALAAGEEVTLPGLGKFAVKDRPAGEGRNPQTGEKIKLAAQRRAKFKPAKSLKEALNQPMRLTGGRRNGPEARL